MDKYEAYQNYWEQYVNEAYQSGTVPDDAGFPRITYTIPVAEFEQTVSAEVNLWDRSTSWKDIKQKSDEIYDAIGLGGVLVPYDNGNGKIWIRRGVPFAQPMQDADDELVRRMYILLELEFFTNK